MATVTLSEILKTKKSPQYSLLANKRQYGPATLCFEQSGRTEGKKNSHTLWSHCLYQLSRWSKVSYIFLYVSFVDRFVKSKSKMRDVRAEKIK